MRRSAPVTFRWLVAGIVAVLTLLGGSLRASPIEALRTRLALEHVERTRDGVDRAHLDRGGELSRGRLGRPAASDPPSPEHAAALRSLLPAFARQRAVAVRLSAPPATVDVPARRVRAHVENMVFLI